MTFDVRHSCRGVVKFSTGEHMLIKGVLTSESVSHWSVVRRQRMGKGQGGV